MKRLITVLLVFFTVFSITSLRPGGSTTHASVMRYESVTLGSLALVDEDHSKAVTLSASQPGSYRGTAIRDGIELICDHAEVKLNGKYDQLQGTAYETSPSMGNHLAIYDTSDPTHKRPLMASDVSPDGKVPFQLSVRGVTYLRFEIATCDNANIDVTGTLTAGSPQPTSVVPRYPTGNAGVPAESKVLFAWQPFPNAVNYAIHIWLVSLSGSTVLQPTTPITFSTSIYHKTSYTWNNHGFLPGTYQYNLLPLDDSGHAVAGWSKPVSITIAS